MKRSLPFVLTLIAVAVITFTIGTKERVVVVNTGVPTATSSVAKTTSTSTTKTNTQKTKPPATPKRMFREVFSKEGVLEESGEIWESIDPNWSVTSGASLVMLKGTARTLQGKLPAGSKWQKKYAVSNPIDTENGFKPQNIFRLATRTKWLNYEQEVYTRVLGVNESESPNRNASNGIFLFNRYENADNLYYTGIRVDGTIVIKKKVGGAYYTMAQGKLYEGVYDSKKEPNLIPKNVWVGLKSIVRTTKEGVVEIEVYTDKSGKGIWDLQITAKDSGKSGGGAPILKAGYGGIRTDFLETEFDNYKITELD